MTFTRKTFRSVLVSALLAAGFTFAWVGSSPAGSYQAPLAVTTVTETTAVSSEDAVRVDARCPAGSVATGGGVRVAPDSPVLVESDSPARDARGWDAQVASLDEEEGPQRVKVTVLCARGVAR